MGEVTTNVVPTTSIKLRFDRFLLPVSAIRQSICVQSKVAIVITAADCAQPVFFEPSYDPTRREVTYRQTAERRQPPPAPEYDLPAHRAAAESARDLRRRDPSVRRRPARRPGNDRLRDGQSAPRCARRNRATRRARPSDAISTADVYCTKVGARFAGCGGMGCHSASMDANNQPLGAAMGLDLLGTAGIASTAVNQVAHETVPPSTRRSPTRVPFGSGGRDAAYRRRKPGQQLPAVQGIWRARRTATTRALRAVRSSAFARRSWSGCRCPPATSPASLSAPTFCPTS